MRINQKKWPGIVVISLLIIAVLIVVMYNNAQKTYEEAVQTGVRHIQEQTEISQIDSVYVYYSAVSYYAAIGKDESGASVAVWLRQDDFEQMTVVPLRGGVTEQKARTLFEKETGKSDFLSLTLGMENQIPIWLFTFKNESGKLNYYYLTFKDGKWWKKVENI